MPFQPLPDDLPALQHAPILTATLKTFAYVEANGPIGLTPAKALKRYFVEWAAEAFEWPHYGTDYLYDLNKVLNERDFAPLMILHDVWLGLRLVRNHKGTMAVTKAGKALAQQPAALWAILAHHLLFEFDHTPHTRFDDRLHGHWGIYLNMLNIEAQDGITHDRFASLVTGLTEEGLQLDYHFRPLLYVHVLRPLAWTGLLTEHRDGREHLFVKSPLWSAALRLETDIFRPPQTRH